MDGSAPGKDLFFAFDRAAVPDSWWPDLSRTLLELGEAIPPIDRPILAPLAAHLAQYQSALRLQAAMNAPVEPPKEIHEHHPGSATLFRYRHGRSAGLERLTSIGLCALLEASEAGRGPAKRLLSIVRGAMDSSNSPLSGALGAISSIPELVRIVDTDEPTRRALPQHFLQLWDAWLRDTLYRWMLTDPERMRQALESPALTPQLEHPVLPVALEPGYLEGGTTLSCRNASPSTHASDDTPTSIRSGRAASDLLERESAGDLMVSPEQRLPRPLDERLCRESVRSAFECKEEPVRAEPYAALALILAGAVREIDLRNVVWGNEGAARPFAIDPIAPVLYRRLKRPASAVVPPKQLSNWWLMPSTEVMAWPLPRSVHASLLSLSSGAPITGQGVLPMLSASPASPYRMLDVIAGLLPEAKVGALAPRLALASEITAALGSEVAQTVMADTFGMPSVPAYYSSLPEAELATFIAGIQARRFGEQVRAPDGRDGYVGSRLVLTNQAAKLWPTQLTSALKSASRQPDGWLEQWHAHRTHLVAALCSATGHRPEDALGRIFLWDVIPEYGLIILQDKQVDALRATRIAATGRLWLSDLRRYLDRLIDIAARHKGEPAGNLANAILRNDEPLFSVLTLENQVAPMTAGTLRNGMPQELQSVDNFFRHRLNQCLLARRVDPELRHAQMGWVVSPAHLHADVSPRAPIDMGRDLGSVIDDVLVQDGWYLPSARKTRWTWNGIPMPAPVDWEAVFSTQKRQHEENSKRIRLRLRERWKEIEGPVMSRLADAFQEFCPLLRVDIEKKCLVQIHGGKGPVELGPDHHALICDRVKLGDQEPSSGLEAVVARILLYRLVRRGRDRNLVLGPIPGRPFLSVTSEPSPFVPGLGAAIRHAHAIRQDLETRANAGYVRDLGPLTAWSILAFSMYRRVSWAQAALQAARTAMRGQQRRHVLRVDARVDGNRMHMVFSGVPAVLLARRKRHAPTSPAPSRETLDEWAYSHLSHNVIWGGRALASVQIESVLAAAARIELSGIERLLIQMGSQTAAESPVRCVARDENWPVLTSDSTSSEKDANGVEQPRTETNPSKPALVHKQQDFDRFMGFLNKRTFAQSRAKKSSKRKNAADGQHGWRRALRASLVTFRDEIGSNSNLALLVSYVLDHLRYGSEDGHRLSHNSLRREVSQIGRPLLTLLEDRSLVSLPSEELRRLYRDVLLSKSVESRPYAFEELHRFHRYLMRVHARPAVDMAELSLLAGSRQLGIEPGLLTPAERKADVEELEADFENEAKRADASPDYLRLAQLQRLYFLILEAAGIRPGSAYGLTHGDIHFLGDAGDFVHVRTGAYGEAKTSTSVGFVRLEGELWDRHRTSVEHWIAEQRKIHPDGWRDLPLFGAETGQRVRVHEHHLTSRINALLKWACGNRDASCYWLRKTRISERYQSLASKGVTTVRELYRTMVASGHAWIQIAVERYINDPTSLLFVDQRTGCEAPRSLLLAMSGLDHGPLDAAWSRAGRDGATRLGIVLDRVEANSVATPAEHRTAAPALRRFKTLQPAHVDAFARAMQRHRDAAEATLAAGITAQQAFQLEKAASDMLVRRGSTLWKLEGATGTRYVLPAPRKIAGSEKWFDLLAQEPSDTLKDIAESWMRQPHAVRLHGEGTMMLVEPAHLATLHALLEQTGLEMKMVTQHGHHLLKSPPQTKYAKGHRAALRWVLSIIWLYGHATTGSD